MEELENKNSQNGGGVEYDRSYESSPKSEKKSTFHFSLSIIYRTFAR